MERGFSMKTILKMLIVLTGIIALGVGSIRAEALGEEKLSVSMSDGEYILSRAEGDTVRELFSSESLNEILLSSFITDGVCVEFIDISINEELNLNGKNLSFSGSLEIYGKDFLISESEVVFDNFNLTLTLGSVKLKSGSIEVFDSKITSDSASCIVLDRQADARLVVKSGEICTDSQSPAIYSTLGVLEISGGRVSSSGGFALESKSSVFIGGNACFEGKKYDLAVSSAVSLYANGEFRNSVRIKFDTLFSEGALTPVLYWASAESVDRVRIFDSLGREQSLTFFRESEYFDELNFCGVYLPFSVSYYTDEELLFEKKLLSCDPVLNFEPEKRLGYSFKSWSYDVKGEDIVDPAVLASSDTCIYLHYELEPVSYLINSYCFTYDGEDKTVAFDYVTHPLLDSGTLFYEWYCENEVVSTSSELKLRGVSDSGLYKCKLTFTYNGDVSVLDVPEFRVEIKPYEIALGTPPPLYYTGECQIPHLSDCEYYDVIGTGGTELGEYSLTLRLKDRVNYKFSSTEEDEIEFAFTILKAENYWQTLPSITSVYEGQALLPKASARFGEVKFLFSSSPEGGFSDSLPTSFGAYFMKACVEGTGNYESLESEAILFELFEEKIVGISMNKAPQRTSYLAFDKISLDGAEFVAHYNSGKRNNLPISEIDIFYNNADCLRFGDESVRLISSDAEYILPVTVEKASYDISGISFESRATVYDGSKKTVPYFGVLPTGKDGIPLTASVVGFGVDAGEYTVKLVFSSESRDYLSPQPIYAKLYIAPLEREIVWQCPTFVYSGSYQAPVAYFQDELGERVYASVRGGKINAGIHQAIAECSDTNYLLKNTSYTFTINKADYDLSEVRWSESSFVYDGEEKRVHILGLPSGVELAGYVDNKGVSAGKYRTLVSLSYDSTNYNEPMISPYEWEIKPADYELSGFDFYDTEVIYDGVEHFPLFVGNLPIGADGSTPEYSFSRGAVSVSEEAFFVTVTFTTSSGNYNPPPDIVRLVEILPRGIVVEWRDTAFVYSGIFQVPKAYSDVCSVSVSGAAIDAGEYTATAESLDRNYYVINSSTGFSVSRAENAFVSPVTFTGFYEGEDFVPQAEVLAGTLVFRFFIDSACKSPISKPSTPGKYYCIAESDGGKNYLPIKSEVIEFEILPLLPVELAVKLLHESFSAYSMLTAEDFELTILYNSGKRETVDANAVKISYPSGSLRVSDTALSFSAFGLSVSTAISVKKADFDLSLVKWSFGEFTYDGEEKSIYLDMLPDGLSVSSYLGNGCKDAGEYTVVPVFAYDTENYNPPMIENGKITVKKRILTVPESFFLEYSGEYLFPAIDNSELFEISEINVRDSGVYPIKLILKDKKNYAISGDDDGEVSIDFTVLPRELEIIISDLEIGWNEEPSEPEYSIIGELVPGDGLLLEFYYEGDLIACRTGNPNYKICVKKGRLVRAPRVTDELKLRLLSFVLPLCLLTFLLLFFAFRKRKNKILLASVLAIPPAPPVLYLSEPRLDWADSGINTDILSVDVEEADGLISDDMAKTLIKKTEFVATWGRRRGIINIDTLGEHFSDGDRVDINAMKNKRLIPHDVANIKVLAKGNLNKQLRVYANSFSLSAVKMIALTGGEAVKVKTLYIKRPHDPDE